MSAYTVVDVADIAHGHESLQYPRSLFVRSSYWNCWSRVLQYGGFIGDTIIETIEVDCTPVNGAFGDWTRTSGVCIRKHLTARDPKDVISRYLPEYVVAQMHEKIGDLLPMIDWNKYEAVSHAQGGGGVRLFNDCLRDPC
jgi:hypothetical protein